MRKLLQLWEKHVGHWYDFATPIYVQRGGLGFMMTPFWRERMFINPTLGYLLSIFTGRTAAVILVQPIPFFRVRLWWHRLFIRKDEFHRSLNMDTDAMARMTDVERTAYQWDLVRRRNIAHERDCMGRG